MIEDGFNFPPGFLGVKTLLACKRVPTRVVWFSASRFWPRPYGQALCECQQQPVELIADIILAPERPFTITTLKAHDFRFGRRGHAKGTLYVGQCKDCGAVFVSVACDRRWKNAGPALQWLSETPKESP